MNKFEFDLVIAHRDLSREHIQTGARFHNRETLALLCRACRKGLFGQYSKRYFFIKVSSKVSDYHEVFALFSWSGSLWTVNSDLVSKLPS